MSENKITELRADDPKESFIGPSILEKSKIISYLALLKREGINVMSIYNKASNTSYEINEKENNKTNS